MITVITPTHNRPAVWPLLERWMRAQTRPPAQWIVVDDGDAPPPLTMGQQYLRRQGEDVGGASLARNLLAAIPAVRGQYVFLIEDDDYYAPDHIAMNLERLEAHEASGCSWMRYYNVEQQGWRKSQNACSTLSGTSFRASKLPTFRQACETALATDTYHVDRYFWRKMKAGCLHEERTMIGMKGMPGEKGIGIGHRKVGWHDDPLFAKLRAWTGSDWRHYEPFCKARRLSACTVS